MVSILGCGWLGLPLGKELVAKGFDVKGSVRSEEKYVMLEDAGIVPFIIRLMPELHGDAIPGFFSADVLVVNFPPERRADISEYLTEQIKALIAAVITYKIPHVIFISSTSVYPDVNRKVDETESILPAKGSGIALQLAETLLLEQTAFKTTVVRFGGLVGYDRLPGRFLAAKKGVANGDAPVNIIHQDDCIAVIYEIIRQNCWGEVFNACADEHPLRRDYYREAAVLSGFEPPEFAAGGDLSFKIVDSSKLKARLNYHFKYPDPLEMLINGG